MRLIQPDVSVDFVFPKEAVLNKIEKIGRVAYKSEDRITDDSSKQFVKMIVGNWHYSVIEHHSVTAKFVVDRGVSHELVRHRIGSYTQESTRYCNYSKDKFDSNVTFVIPTFLSKIITPTTIKFNGELVSIIGRVSEYIYTHYGDCFWNNGAYTWLIAMASAERSYFDLLNSGHRTQEARSVLPNSLKTEVYVTFNLREWLHFFRLRTAKNAHPDMRFIAMELYNKFNDYLPEIFNEENLRVK